VYHSVSKKFAASMLSVAVNVLNCSVCHAVGFSVSFLDFLPMDLSEELNKNFTLLFPQQQHIFRTTITIGVSN